MSNLRTIQGGLDEGLKNIGEFQAEVEKAIERCPGTMTIAHIVGVLEFIKFNIIMRSNSGGDER